MIWIYAYVEALKGRNHVNCDVSHLDEHKNIGEYVTKQSHLHQMIWINTYLRRFRAAVTSSATFRIAKTSATRCASFPSSGLRTCSPCLLLGARFVLLVGNGSALPASEVLAMRSLLCALVFPSEEVFPFSVVHVCVHFWMPRSSCAYAYLHMCFYLHLCMYIYPFCMYICIYWWIYIYIMNKYVSVYIYRYVSYSYGHS